MDQIRVLVVDDDAEHREYVKSLLELMNPDGFEIDYAKGVNSGITQYDKKLAEGSPYELAFVDLVRLPPENLGGKAVVKHIQKEQKDQTITKIILMSSHDPNYEHTLELVGFGVTDFLGKPLSEGEFRFRIGRVIEEILLNRRLVDLQQRIDLNKEDANSEHKLVGSLCQGEFYYKLSEIAKSEITVLIRGETGTGKEVIAREILRLSSRQGKPFIAFNCAKYRKMDSAILIGEVFGYEKGSHDGAYRRKKGFVELAEGGTLLIDEIGASSDDFQAMLLRLLAEHEYETLSGETKRADVRIVAATNTNLEEAIAKGAFREDLFARLDEFTIKIPALRERRQDISTIVDYFLDHFRQMTPDCKVERISAEAMKQLENHDWPLNIRELKNVIHRICILCKNKTVIQPEDISSHMSTYRAVDGGACGWKFTGEGIRHNVSVKREVAKLELSYLKYFQDNEWTTRDIGNALGSTNLNLSQFVANREVYLNELSHEAPHLVEHFIRKYPKSVSSQLAPIGGMNQ